MTPERWRRITEIFHAAVAQEVPARSALLDAACADDMGLRAEVEAMLAAHPAEGSSGQGLTLACFGAPRHLSAGAALGPYRIDTLIGAGGMGEVYRAHDSRLGRTVAVKVLPALLAGDRHLRQRLERESRTLAALSHPNICPIFDVGRQGDVDYLVMEYLEGETLADRLAKGPLPLPQALRYAREIAAGLAAAHRQGVVHRDLKPGNVMLTKAGARLLDFGLATRRPLPPGMGGEPGPGEERLTGEGRIAGTLHYMAPEQLHGQEADARTDIFALGAVTYEMVTGAKAFDAPSQAGVMAAILEHEPVALSKLQPAAPPALDHLVSACLAKDADRRWQSAGDIGRYLEWVAGERSAPHPAAQPSGHAARRAGSIAGAAVAGGLLVGLAAWFLGSARRSEPPPVGRFDYAIPDGLELRNPDQPVMAFSADGRYFVYNTNRGLYLRSLDEPEARLIPGTEEDLSNPFISPDGRWVGYFSGGQLKRIAATGGTPLTLCAAERAFGAHWMDDATIVYGQPGGVRRVPETGGSPEWIFRTEPGEVVYGPQVMPGGEWLLLTIARETGDERWDRAQIVAHSLRSRERKVIWTGGSDARYVSPGHLLFAVGDVLLAAAFDPRRLTLVGRPVPMVRGIHRAPRSLLHPGHASYGVSNGGTLVHVRVADAERDRVLALVDRQGHVERLDIPPAPYVNPRLSPDGRRIVVQTLDEDTGWGDIWVYEREASRQIRQLTIGANSRYPIWTPDSANVTYVSDRDGSVRLYSQPVDGGAAVQLATGDGAPGRPDSWSPSGPTLAFRMREPEDVAIFTLGPGTDARPALFHDVPGSAQYEAEFSPDGRWIAYTSTETGRDEVYVQPYPPTGAKVRVTQAGGTFPIWSAGGRELIYRRSFDAELYRSQGARLYSVSVTTTGGFGFGAERVLPIEGFLVFNTYRDYDVTRDGKRLLLVYPAERRARPAQIHIVQNWFEELAARAVAN